MDPAERLAASQREFGEYGGCNNSVEVSTTFTVMQADTLPQIFGGSLSPDAGGCYLYGRSFNPTVRYLGRQLAALEGTEAGYGTSSGMSAIACTLLRLCNTGDHIVASRAVYGGTFSLLDKFLPAKCGVSVTFVSIADFAAVRAAITDRTKVIYTESMSNPTLVVSDIPALAKIAHDGGIKLVVDNTFSPVILSPAIHGADVVVHSLTKFVSGASDVIAVTTGAICGTGEFLAGLMSLNDGSLMLLGPTMDPRQAGHRVLHPGLKSHPQHELFQRLSNKGGYGAGGLLTLDLGTTARANALMEALQNDHGFGLMAVSLGYFDTLMSCSAASTSSELSATELEAAGISPGMLRMSIGLTGSIEQRWQQLSSALKVLDAAADGPDPKWVKLE